MKRAILTSIVLAVTTLSAMSEALVATAVTNDEGSIIAPYDAKMLTAELASYREVWQKDFYYLRIFPRAHVQGKATLSTGQKVEWFHYACGGLYLRFKDGTERYFLYTDKAATANGGKKKEPDSPGSK